jgi:hypothetical protein
MLPTLIGLRSRLARAALAGFHPAMLSSIDLSISFTHRSVLLTV